MGGGSGAGVDRGNGGMGYSRDNNMGRARNSESEAGAGGARQRDIPGLNPRRDRGFQGWQRRIETPSLNDMRAKQGAVVSKFMTFMNRKNTLMIELYERAFYTRKPGWDLLANFVYNDLCPTDQLRQSLEDVQFHPVKMIIFIKFNSEDVRDQIVARLQGMNGVMWTDYGVSVRGHSLDANVKIIRILGVSPETTAEDIKNTFVQVGVGEVVDLRRGFLDPRRMPGVTNGTWLARVKILDPDKHIPPYIIRREEGELWSLNFEGRRFVCWKCGSPDHIGDKCRDQERTFEEVFGNEGESEGEDAPLSWAAIVKGDTGLGEDLRARRDAIAKQIKDNNEVKAQERKEVEDKRMADLEKEEQQKRDDERVRKEALDKANNQGKDFVNRSVDGADSDDDLVSMAGDRVSEVNLDLQFPPLLQRVTVGRRSVQVGGVDGVKGREQREGGGGVGKVTDIPGGDVQQGGVKVGEVEEDPGSGDDEDQGSGDDKDPVSVDDKDQRSEDEEEPGSGMEDDPGGGIISLVVHGFDPSLRSDSLQSVLTDPELPPLGGISFTLDRSLERVFGQGATQLAIGFESVSAQGVGHDISECSSLDRTVPVCSTPGREGSSKKRMREEMETSFGNLSGFSMNGDFQGGAASGDEDEGDSDGEYKKPRLVGEQESLDIESGVETETEIDSEGEEGSQNAGGVEPLQVLPGDDPHLLPRGEQELVSDSEQVHGESC